MPASEGSKTASTKKPVAQVIDWQPNGVKGRVPLNQLVGSKPARPGALGGEPLADFSNSVEVGTCAKGKLAQAIANDNYHVLVVATMNDAERQAVDSFLARGGGVLVCNPNWSSVEGMRQKAWWPVATNRLGKLMTSAMQAKRTPWLLVGGLQSPLEARESNLSKDLWFAELRLSDS